MSPADKLAQSLSALKALQDQQRVGIQSSELTRTHRERLLQQGFLREVMKGWFIPTRPDTAIKLSPHIAKLRDTCRFGFQHG